jgi:polar amino acid transport system substrate-binding protein
LLISNETMKVRIAYLDEPPFYWTAPDCSATGADIELADVVLRAIGVTAIEHRKTSFDELLPGVQAGRWDMNVPIFATADRAQHVAFSVPVWTMVDGFVVHRGNPKALTSYEAVAARADARLGVISAQVQYHAARSAGVSAGQLVEFKDQAEAVAALLAGRIDAFTGTALGGRVLANANQELEALAHDQCGKGNAPVGAFSFSKDNTRLLDAVNQALRRYLGSADHRARMAKYGFTAAEIDGIASNASSKT